MVWVCNWLDNPHYMANSQTWAPAAKRTFPQGFDLSNHEIPTVKITKEPKQMEEALRWTCHASFVFQQMNLEDHYTNWWNWTVSKFWWKTVRNFQCASVFNVILLKATLAWYVVCWLGRNDRLLLLSVPLVSHRISIVNDWLKEELGNKNKVYVWRQFSFLWPLKMTFQMQDSLAPSFLSNTLHRSQPPSANERLFWTDTSTTQERSTSLGKKYGKKHMQFVWSL